MNDVQTIIEELNEHVDDTAALNQLQSWALSAAHAARALKRSPEFKRDPLGSYQRLYGICGGKSWYRLLDGRSDAGIAEAVEREFNKRVASRNAKVAAALHKIGVNTATGIVWASSADGFSGTFRVQTDKGQRTVTLRVITAGGYNVQCLHARVLVKAH